MHAIILQHDDLAASYQLPLMYQVLIWQISGNIWHYDLTLRTFMTTLTHVTDQVLLRFSSVTTAGRRPSFS